MIKFVEIHFNMILFLSDVAGSEILLILFFVLIFFGSKSIPNLARTMGRTIRQIKDASDELQNEIKKSGMDIKKDLNLTNIIEETAQDIQAPLQKYTTELDEALRFEPPTKFESPEITDEELTLKQEQTKPKLPNLNEDAVQEMEENSDKKNETI